MSDPKLEKARRELKQALREEQEARSHLGSFAKTTPLPPMEDVESTDADALRRAIERMAAATEHRKKMEQECDELPRERGDLNR